MRRGPLIHGALLVLALVVAYQTWTRDETIERADRGDFTVWEAKPTQIVSIRYQKESREVVLERRSDDAGTYWWAKSTETRTPPKPPKPPGTPDAGLESTPDEPATPEPVVTTKEYLVGKGGETLVEAIAPLRALRDLGPLDDDLKKTYKLDEPQATLVVQLDGDTRELDIGDRVLGARYVLDRKTGRGYALKDDVLRPLDNDTSLQEFRIHGFDKKDVAGAKLDTGDTSFELVRKSGGSAPRAPDVWARAETPDDPDQTMANLMDRILRLSIRDFTPDETAEGKTKLVRVDYTQDGGKPLGFVELYKKKTGDKPTDVEFFMRTEHTRVMVRIPRGFGERVDQDLTQILGS